MQKGQKRISSDYNLKSNKSKKLQYCFVLLVKARIKTSKM